MGSNLCARHESETGEWPWGCSTARSRSSPAPGAASAASEALLLAAEGAPVVVNDLGGAAGRRGRRRHPGPAGGRRDRRRRRRGRRQLRRHLDVGRRRSASCSRPSSTFGGLDVLVNNAGILRDRHELQHDRGRVGRGHRRAPQGPLRDRRDFAAAYWREQVEGDRATRSTARS